MTFTARNLLDSSENNISPIFQDSGSLVKQDTDSLRAMRRRLESHVVPALTGARLSLRRKLSEGAFGTVYVADAAGLPEYGSRDIISGIGSDNGNRLVAVKFLADNSSEQER